ncbi:LacI family DNA-binding transcriptional regulator [Terriglobus albidus]|uniref:LacI family DNA-binding transcriptional regulator n=1 Tax=Terriglobus albidus TaxID=1592106 RepID=UPI0021E06D34|nr:LacI family DNA-binding transcriptional regulator [Terriglobus albidus]
MKKRKRSDARSAKSRLDIRTVAHAAGVSVATVSRVINKVPSVDPALAKKVWESIQKLGYVPNTQARALVSGRSKLLGVIISDITNPFFPELIQGFEDKAVEVGYETLIGSTNYDLQRMELCIQRMLERKVEGVAVMTFGIEEPLLDRLASQGIPMVFIDLAPKKKGISTIRVDYQKGIYEAVQHLAVLGHRRIAFISGPERLHSAVARLQAFRNAVDDIGLRVPESYVFYGDHTVEGGERGVEHLLTLSRPPTAIMCSNDMTAIGAMHALSRAGLSIPRDISLIGFDDIRISEYMLPPLTTIRMSGRDIAASAVTALLDSSTPPRDVETKLVVRQTTTVPAGTLADLRKKSGKAQRGR